MAPPLEATEWRSLAEQASTEMDSAKLMILVEKLCCALDDEQPARFHLARAHIQLEPKRNLLTFPGNAR